MTKKKKENIKCESNNNFTSISGCNANTLQFAKVTKCLNKTATNNTTFTKPYRLKKNRNAKYCF